MSAPPTAVSRPFGRPVIPPPQTPPAVASAAPRAAFGRPFGRPVALPAPAAAEPPGGTPDALPTPAARAGLRLPEPDTLLEGFVRVDGSLRPARVSEAAWAEVFPADYPRVRRVAGRFFAFGHAPDEAVRLAIAEVADTAWADGPLAARLADLRPLFPAAAGLAPPAAALAAACAVGVTARLHAGEILASGDRERTAFRLRAWHAAPGTCLLCGAPAADDEPHFQGDAINTACKPLMASVGPRFGQLVVVEAERLAAAAPQPWQPDPSVDPDDPATW